MNVRSSLAGSRNIPASKGRGEEDKGEIKFNSLTKKSPRGDFLYLTEVRFYQNFI
jgi:hypothetical protein